MPKIDITKILKDSAITLVCTSIILVMYFIFIGPYLSLNKEFKTDKETLDGQISSLEAKKDILSNSRKKIDVLRKYDAQLNSLVPSDANASDLVGVLDILSRTNNFTVVEENKNAVSTENSKKRLNEVRFNGKTIGMTSAVKFISDVSNYPTKIFNIVKLEITNNFDEKFTRVSFNAFSRREFYCEKVSPN
jgi:Tfp pilus assembly protein PilO